MATIDVVTINKREKRLREFEMKENQEKEPVKMDDMFLAWQIFCILAFVGFSCILYYSVYETFIVSTTTTYQLAVEVVPYELRDPRFFIAFIFLIPFLLTIAFVVTLAFIMWKEWCSTSDNQNDFSAPGVYISIAIFTVAVSVLEVFITYEGCWLYLKAIATGDLVIADFILFLALAGIPFIAFGCWFRHTLRTYKKSKSARKQSKNRENAGKRLFRFLVLARSLR